MKRLRPYLDHGILELDNNTAERAMRSVAVGRKNYLFVGSLTGGRAAAIAYTLIETAKLNGVDPQAWLADTLARIPDYKITRVDELLPWNRRSVGGQAGRLRLSRQTDTSSALGVALHDGTHHPRDPRGGALVSGGSGAVDIGSRMAFPCRSTE